MAVYTSALPLYRKQHKNFSDYYFNESTMMKNECILVMGNTLWSFVGKKRNMIFGCLVLSFEGHVVHLYSIILELVNWVRCPCIVCLNERVKGGLSLKIKYIFICTSDTKYLYNALVENIDKLTRSFSLVNHIQKLSKNHI